MDSGSPGGRSRPAKSHIRSWLACGAFREIADAVSGEVRGIGTLIHLTYDADPLIVWRAVDAIGRCAERLRLARPEMLKNYLRRLFWMMSDEAGSVAWHAPEAIGEIVRSRPGMFSEFIPLTISLLDMEPEDIPPFLPGILYALGRIGERAPVPVNACLPRIVAALGEENAQACAMAIECLRRMNEGDHVSRYPELWQDEREVVLYRNEQLVETTIRLLVAERS
jgi:hypothetical protein